MDLCELRINVRRFFRTKVKRFLVNNYFCLTIIASFLISLSITGCKLNQEAKVIDAPTEEIIEEVSPVLYYHEDTYQVKKGESIWTVACKYNPERTDLTPWVETVREKNNLVGDELTEGQILKVYYYSE